MVCGYRVFLRSEALPIKKLHSDLSMLRRDKETRLNWRGVLHSKRSKKNGKNFEFSCFFGQDSRSHGGPISGKAVH